MTQILHNIEAEQAVLGALMYRPQCWDDIAPVGLRAEDFYDTPHRLIFAAIAELNKKNFMVDTLTVTNILAQQNQLQAIGGEVYVQTLAANVPSATNAPAYATIIRDLAEARGCIQVMREAADQLYAPGDVAVKLDTVRSTLSTILDRQARQSEIRDAKSILYDVFNAIEHAMDHQGEVLGLSTGLSGLDKQITGLHPGNLVIIAGRPSMGKTTLATNIARHAAMRGTPALIFSAEMEAADIMLREIAAVSSISLHTLRTGAIDDSQWPAIHAATTKLKNSGLFVEDTAGGHIHSLRAKARWMKRKHNIGLVVVDYIQLLQADGRSREEEVSAISRTLKHLAKELKIPVVALSQLNRSLESRVNKRPVLADLRESGAIEQDADVVLCLYRDEVYNEQSDYRGLAEILIRKQRNGPVGTAHACFLGEYCRFDDYTGPWPGVTTVNRKSGGLNYSIAD